MAVSYYQRIKAAGGAEYEALKADMREKQRAARERRGRLPCDNGSPRTVRGRQGKMVQKANKRGREKGLPATIRWDDIYWPTHCPVLGLELNYSGEGPKPAFARNRHPLANSASLDRFFPEKGYVPGNVFVISHRANMLKNNATLDEVAAVYRYMVDPPLGIRL